MQMDRKAQRVESIRTRLQNLICKSPSQTRVPPNRLTNGTKTSDEQHGEYVDPKDITNTYRSRAPFPFLFSSDDAKQPKVSIASISQPDHDAMMRLINAGRITATRVNEGSSSSVRAGLTPLDMDRTLVSNANESIGTSPVDFSRQSSISRRDSSMMEDGNKTQFQIPPTLPAFSTILGSESPLPFSQLPPSRLSGPPSSLPRPRSVDSLPPISSYSSAMAIDPPTPILSRSLRWNRIYEDLGRLGSGVAQWGKEIDDLRMRMEDLSKGEEEMIRQSLKELKMELELTKAENSSLKDQVKNLTEENQKVTCERDVLKDLLLERMSQST
ncbi:hypothetical protein TWF694_000916 [Orbilia ellipsospora]|uniref:Uncharacterized protein n=1 Tax=Orbilia ellipsospora TaxID=2528407 RepID=A0AAV9XQC9_9PEZI